MWSPCLTNDYQPILAASLGRQGWTFAFLEGTNLGRSAEEVPVLQEKTEISLCRALLVPQGVPAHPHCRAVLDGIRLGVKAYYTGEPALPARDISGNEHAE